jgi:glycosyltransferase involved in cell wall biosynthesis
LISIVMATYNRAALLPRAIDSVLRQSHTDWELIVVDDGSTDATRGLVAPYVREHSRIRYVARPHEGLAAARNAGIQMASGAIITFLDSDDEYLADHLALREIVMRDHPELHIVHGGVQVTGGPAEVPDATDRSRMIPIAECAVGGTFFLRSRVARELGGFHKPDYGCDFDFLRRASQLYAVHKVDYPTYIYHREHANSMCNTAAAAHLHTAQS